MTPLGRDQLERVIADRLVRRGWLYRRNSATPWMPPGEVGRGYSLLGAAARQADLERAESFRRLTAARRDSDPDGPAEFDEVFPPTRDKR